MLLQKVYIKLKVKQKWLKIKYSTFLSFYVPASDSANLHYINQLIFI